MAKPCTNVDLELDTVNCDATNEVVEIDAFRETEGITTLKINYIDGETGEEKTLQRPIGRR